MANPSNVSSKLANIKTQSISSYFGCNTFNDKTMRELLPRATYKELQECLRIGNRLSIDVANVVAHTMKHWAMERGATHFAHWFMPWTGATAEKHDAFITWDQQPGTVIERFTGGALVQGEPDASSFPSGGLRPTFEARGYTAWDPTSPAFLQESELGTTLCIPSAFIGYHGEALDQKVPLLRSMTYVGQHAARALEFFGIEDARVTAQCGPEQEYFLIDAELAKRRDDLMLCGRTLQGAKHVKGQVMEDHYFGCIKERVLDYMQAFELEAYKLGIPCKTRHNEVAPNQFEVAPIFENANLAADHNQQLMEIMKRVAERMGLVCLLHEKPFDGVNGSGKHVNWSLAAETKTMDVINLLDPGDEPRKSPLFLYFLCACLRALDRHSALLRASVASHSNDSRLGANEAPPAIISAFLGEQLKKTLDYLEEKGVPEGGGVSPARPGSVGSMAEALQLIDMSDARLPSVNRDRTDRNRTSPFAFTGNKFEFRAVGSSQAIHQPLMVINATVGEAIASMNEDVQAKIDLGADTTTAVMQVIVETIKATKRVRFEGDNYSTEWQEEAVRRNLPILQSTVDCLDSWLSPDARTLLISSHIFSESELEARVHAKRENYVKVLMLETYVLKQMAVQHIIPAAFKQLDARAACIQRLQQLQIKNIDKFDRVQDYADRLGRAQAAVDEIRGLLNSIRALEEGSQEQVRFVGGVVKEALATLRTSLDNLEEQTAADGWPIPSYNELLAPHFPKGH